MRHLKMWKRRKSRLYMVSAFLMFCLFTYISTGLRLFLLQLTNTPSIKKVKKIVFIVGPGRTGTTLLGELFNKEKDIVYFFEPLIAVQSYLQYDVFSSRTRKSERLYAAEAMEFLKDIINCKFRSRNDKYLKFLNESKTFHHKSNKFSNCSDTNMDCWSINAETMNHMCQLLLAKNDITVVIKELSFRMPYTDVTYLGELQSEGEVKHDIRFIYSIRDPRAFLESKHRLGWFGDASHNEFKGTEEFVDKSCQVLNQDLESLEMTAREDHIKYKIFRFENLEFENLTVLEESLEAFLGMRLKTKRFFIKMTRKKNTLGFNPLFSINPRDVFFTNNKWRLTIDYELNEVIQSSCGHIMNLLGYRLVSNNSELRNLSLTLVDKPKISGIL